MTDTKIDTPAPSTLHYRTILHRVPSTHTTFENALALITRVYNNAYISDSAAPTPDGPATIVWADKHSMDRGQPPVAYIYGVRAFLKSFRFSAGGLDYGLATGYTREEALDAWAESAGYRSWADMLEQANENGGNNVEVVEEL